MPITDDAAIGPEGFVPYVPRQFTEQARRRFVRMCTAHILKRVPGKPSLMQKGYARSAAPLLWSALKAEKEDSDKSAVAARGHWEAAVRLLAGLERSLAQKPAPPAAKVKPGPPQITLDEHVTMLRQRQGTLL